MVLKASKISAVTRRMLIVIMNETETPPGIMRIVPKKSTREPKEG